MDSTEVHADQPYPVQRATEFLLSHSELRSMVEALGPHFGADNGNPLIRRLSTDSNIVAATHDQYRAACKIDLTQADDPWDNGKVFALASTLFLSILTQDDLMGGTCFVTVANAAASQQYAIINIVANRHAYCGRGGGSSTAAVAREDVGYLLILGNDLTPQRVFRAHSVMSHDCRDGVQSWWANSAVKQLVTMAGQIVSLHSISNEGLSFRTSDGRYLAYIAISSDVHRKARVCSVEELTANLSGGVAVSSQVEGRSDEDVANAVFAEEPFLMKRDTQAYTLCEFIAD